MWVYQRVIWKLQVSSLSGGRIRSLHWMVLNDKPLTSMDATGSNVAVLCTVTPNNIGQKQQNPNYRIYRNTISLKFQSSFFFRCYSTVLLAFCMSAVPGHTSKALMNLSSVQKRSRPNGVTRLTRKHACIYTIYIYMYVCGYTILSYIYNIHIIRIYKYTYIILLISYYKILYIHAISNQWQ